MSNEIEIRISDRSDGYGFRYGHARLGERTCHVNILPPASAWSGDAVLPGYEPDPECWIVYADGEEVARVRKREDLDVALLPRLFAGQGYGASRHEHDSETLPMNDPDIIKSANEVRDGVLKGRPSDLMCAAICWPLHDFLGARGVKTIVMETTFGGFFGEWNHLWLKLPDGRALDPTADQFNKLGGPKDRPSTSDHRSQSMASRFTNPCSKQAVEPRQRSARKTQNHDRPDAPDARPPGRETREGPTRLLQSVPCRSAGRRTERVEQPASYKAFYADRITQLQIWDQDGRTDMNDQTVRAACAEWLHDGGEGAGHVVIFLHHGRRGRSRRHLHKLIGGSATVFRTPPCCSATPASRPTIRSLDCRPTPWRAPGATAFFARRLRARKPIAPSSLASSIRSARATSLSFGNSTAWAARSPTSWSSPPTSKNAASGCAP